MNAVASTTLGGQIMKKVWVVEQGCYSAYLVVGVFSSKKNADLVASKINESERYDKATVAEWELDPGVDALNKGYTVWLGEMLFDGTVERMVKWDFDSFYSIGGLNLWKRSETPSYREQGVQDCLYGQVLAKNKKHAVKIFNERRAQMIATGEWRAPL